jgi:hypothetical protein
MQTSAIISLINKLNKGSLKDNIIKHSISPNVEFAHIWIKENYNSNIPYNFFLIRNDIEYVGAVLDMIYDLHWVILPRHRRKGYLKKALKGSILPYIFDHLDRDEQKISLNINETGLKSYNSSLNCALKVGFKKNDDKNLLIDVDDFDFSNLDMKLIHKGLNDNEIQIELLELELAAKKIYQINSKIEMSFGVKTETYLNPSLDELSRRVSNFKTAITDIQDDYNNKND